MKRPQTLFAKTGITLVIALGTFLVFSVSAMVYFILIPLAKQGADDLAALMVLSAQTWVELPPATRPFLEEELMDEYQLKLNIAEGTLPRSTHLLPFLRFLEAALAERVGEPVSIRFRRNSTIWFCADIPMGGRTIRVSFPSERIGARPPTASLAVLGIGTIVILLTTLLLVRRLTQPLARLSEAAARLGRGETLEPLPESGPRELAQLTHSFNRMGREVSELLENRTTLFAGISHDLRTPLTRMQLALEMLPPETDPEISSRLRQDVEKMNHLISNTLAFARGLTPGEPQDVAVRELIDGIVTAYRQGGTEILWKPDVYCACTVDIAALQRVLNNLVDNAIRYGSGQPVEMRCNCDDRHVSISVLDRGPGIPEAEREAVFRPFHRLETSRSRVTGGSGLGLAIAQQLCMANGWLIELLARAGGGTEARVRIKAA
jgi:two-component system osmolarity sensor histidine kinase EnvZ